MTNPLPLPKDQRERLIFAAFAAAASLCDEGDSFESRLPPEPDILLRSGKLGLQAFELVEIVDQGLQSTVAAQLGTKTICREHLESLPLAAHQAFSAKYANADIAFEFRADFSQQRRKNFLPKLFAALLSLPDGFEGDASVHDLGISGELFFLSVSRGNLVGPLFNAGSAVWVGDPTVDAIRGKTTKAYSTPAALNLLAYFESYPLLPDDVWLPTLDSYLDSLGASCQFERIYVFAYQTKTVERVWQRAP